MHIYQGLEAFKQPPCAVVTTGTFDGVHLGHRTILDRLSNISQEVNGESVLLTFDPHPRIVLHPKDHGLSLLNTKKEKIALLEKAGIDHLIIHPFTKDFSRLSSIEFIRDVLVNKIGTKKLVIGYDHHFGRNREGAFESLQECGPTYGFDVEEIPAKEVDNVNISSSKIRQALNDGDIATAYSFLGYDYMISGSVQEGSKIGRDIGFPTANIHIANPYKLIPADGVYAVKVTLEGRKLYGMLNIGVRPTMHQNDNRTVEVHIFDFDEEIYDKEITVHLKKRIRDEKKFENAEALKAQLELDRNESQATLI